MFLFFPPKMSSRPTNRIPLGSLLESDVYQRLSGSKEEIDNLNKIQYVQLLKDLQQIIRGNVMFSLKAHRLVMDGWEFDIQTLGSSAIDEILEPLQQKYPHAKKRSNFLSLETTSTLFIPYTIHTRDYRSRRSLVLKSVYILILFLVIYLLYSHGLKSIRPGRYNVL